LGSTLALANQKGGVGKTTTAVNLAVYLAARGQRVLLIDLDPQGNATSSLGVDKRQLRASAYDVLIDGAQLRDTITSDVRTRLDLLGANPALAGAEIELVNLTRQQLRLRAALEPLRADYAVTIIDCPPSLGLLTVNALTAADEVLIPIQCEYLALEGLMQLINTIDLIKRRLNPALDVLGVAMTMYDARTRLSAQVVDEVRRYFPNRMFTTLVPRSVRLAEAPSHGRSIFEYDSGSRGALAYRELGEEVAGRLRLPAAGTEPVARDAHVQAQAQPMAGEMPAFVTD
jgi:chromosome partitioning protein